MAVTELAWLLNVPSYLLTRHEQARSRLLMMTNILKLCSTYGITGAVDATDAAIRAGERAQSTADVGVSATGPTAKRGERAAHPH
ncbi:hypothetical protein ABQF17_08370 [Mycolicibacterium elephantis]